MKPLSTRSILLIVLGAIVILALGVFVMQKKEVTSEIPVEVVENEEGQENQEKNPENLENGEETINTSDWQTYRNEEYSVTFKHPKECEYASQDLSDVAQDTSLRKEVVTLIDTNEICPSIQLVARNLTSPSSKMQKSIEINYEETPIVKSYGWGYNEYEVVSQISESMYQLTGYTNLECYSSIVSGLYTLFPENSHWEYSRVGLGDVSDFDEDEFENRCILKKNVYIKGVQDIVSGENAFIQKNRDMGIALLRSLQL